MNHAPKEIQAYDLQRVGTDNEGVEQIISRGPRVPCSARPLDRLKTADLTWAGGVDFGLVLSGQKLIDNKDYRNELTTRHPEAIGGEMEGAGLFAAAVEKAEWVLVKAICDWADGNKSQEKKERQRAAAKAAAEFVVYAIGQGGFAPEH